MKQLKSHKTFSGKTQFWSHESVVTKTLMKFSTFIPEGEIKGCLIWLSGLTCTEENFITKAGAQKYLAEHQMMVICPDTSPRGLNLPGEHDSYDFGSGASFYLNATVDPYASHYKMDDYINSELYSMIRKEFKVQNISISGHSMGGHGALTLGLKNPEKYKSVSAFSPVVHPSVSPWGMKAFTGYFGNEKSLWEKHDATELLKAGLKHPAKILIHQGLQDEFLEKELLTQSFIEAAKAVGQSHEVKFCEGFDHSYYFIATFIEEHIKHHALH
jgi:S-formylglutathione hydrolase